MEDIKQKTWGNNPPKECIGKCNLFGMLSLECMTCKLEIHQEPIDSLSTVYRESLETK